MRLPRNVVEAVERELRSVADDGRRAVFVIDVNRLAVVNVALGAAAGDRVIAEFERRIRSWAGDGSVVRDLGAGQFLAVVPGTGGSDGLDRAEALQDALAEPVPVGTGTVTRSVSVGVAADGPAGSTLGLAELIRHAEFALFSAKGERGSPIRLWDAELAEGERRTAHIELGLPDALRSGAGLLLHYQPECDLRTGDLRAVEALARWDHPEFGLLGAESFVPVAEASGTMTALGRWVLAGAFAQRAEWAARFPASQFVLRANVSPTQLHDPTLPAFVAGLLERHGLRAGQVGVELTEQVRTIESDRAGRTLDALRRLGLQIAIDDFGVAHSTPARLDAFPFDLVKIDGRFVHASAGNEATRSVVAWVVRLAAQLGIAVVAEGIEDGRDAADMLALGCTRGQGNGLMPAVEAAELTPVIAAGRLDLPPVP